MAKKQTLSIAEHHELQYMPDILYVDVDDMGEDPDFEKAKDSAYLCTYHSLDSVPDGALVTEYRAVRRYRVVEEVKTHKIAVE